MTDIIGIIPGAGRASRIGGFFKELTPININPADTSRFVVVSERTISLLRRGGASPIYFVVNGEKGVIAEYYNKSSTVAVESLYFTFQADLEKYYGMPFAIDKVYHEAIGKTVLMGMPDTLIEPDDAYETLLRNFKKHNSDIELGLFPTEPNCFGGLVETDERSRVVRHIDKTAPDFPFKSAASSWAIACWGSRFTEFLHRYVETYRKEQENRTSTASKELLFGDVIDAALASKDITVSADFISQEQGYYLDITEPSKYFQAVLHYHSSTVSHSRNRKKSVFISHSSQQKVLADTLHGLLEAHGYDPKLDLYEIHGGDEIPSRISNLIKEADYFVALLSNASVSSKWVQGEIGLAVGAGLINREALLPVEIEEIPPQIAASMPFISKSSMNWQDGTKSLRGIVDWLNRKERSRRNR